ncbi:phage terminase large subunit, partial [Listeria seeligeri]
SNLAFDVGPAQPDQSPSVKSVGINGQLTGSRADTIIADDIEVPKNSMTVVQREKLAELVKEFDAVLKPGGEIIYLGTPQTEESLYNKLPERGYVIRIWP